MPTPAELYEQAVRCHQGGLLVQAETLYRQVIARDPGVVGAHNNLGIILLEQGKAADALVCFRQALRLNPNHANSHNNLGNAYKESGQFAEAAACFQEALRLMPTMARAHNNLALTRAGQGMLAQAIEGFRQALRLDPNLPDAHNNLGSALQSQGKLAEATMCFRQAVRLSPGFANALNNLGTALTLQGQLDEAISCFQQGSRLAPANADMHNNLGNAFLALGRCDEAAASFQEALRLQPNLAEVHANLGNVLKDQGQLEEALACYARALELKPDYVTAHDNYVYTLNYRPGQDAVATLEECKAWNRRHAEPLARFIRPHLNDKSPERRLRIGYVSPDFRYHPVGRFLITLLASHDHAKFEIFCYSAVQVPDALTERCRSLADGWRSLVGLTDAQAAELIRQDRVDILVDLAMHTMNNRLLVFAHKPAPVQVTYLAYAGTTGMEAMDYRLTDPYLDPPGQNDQSYSESSIRLADTYWCYAPVMETPEPTSLPAPQPGQITFGCLNNFCKVTVPTLETWAVILQSTAGARLLLHAPTGSHRERVATFFEKRGVAAGRINFVDKLPGREYFRTYARIHIGLDPFPFGGGTTTCDALWTGVPVISLAGQTAVTRSGVSILSNVGLTELLARNAEEYVDIAVKLAGDVPRLTALRAGLRERLRTSRLMDGARFARSVEAAYRAMWRAWCI
jgi:protein O-GlcNAc transferase